MAWSLVQNNGADNTNGSGVASYTVTFTSNVAAGNVLVVGVGSSHAITGCTDSHGNVYSAILTNESTTWSGLFWTIAKSSGANTVTVTGSTFFPGVGLAEFAPPAGTVVLDAMSASYGSSAPFITPAIPLNGTALVLGAIGADANPTITAGSGFTVAYASAGGAGAEATGLEYLLNDVAATRQVTWTLSPAHHSSYCGAALIAVPVKFAYNPVALNSGVVNSGRVVSASPSFGSRRPGDSEAGGV